MIKKAIAIIPARGGSKRIPRKNIKDFFGKPLIAYSIQTALESELFDKVIVSTDDEEIARIAKKYGAEVPFIRPKELSDDFTSTADVINHAIEYLKKQGKNYEYVCTIYATAPLLQKEFLIDGLEKLKNSDAINSFSATSMPFPIQRTFKLDKDGRCEMFTPEHYMARSQDLEEAYQDAGQFYWTNRSRQEKCENQVVFSDISIPIILPRHLVQDIDTLEDWERAEFMYQALYQDIYDKWNSLKKNINKKEYKFYVKEREIYFMSIGHNIGYEAYGKDELFLRPVLVYKRLTHSTFIGIPLTSKPKEGSYYFKFSYKKDKYSYASLNQIRVFDTKRTNYKSGRIKSEDFNKLCKQILDLLNITSNIVGGCITSKKKQRSNESIVTKYKTNVKKMKSPKILALKEIKSHIETLNDHCVQSSYLFGSYSRNSANLFSDIDILLIFGDIEYKQIGKIVQKYKNYFYNLGYVCNPIYSYSKYLENDSNILIRQYIKNGIFLFGDDFKSSLPYESDKQLAKKEYKNYWQSNYLRKLETIKVILNDNNSYDILTWQYIYQVLYWYAKAELTLQNKQHSLNEYTLNYIYQVLLNKKLNSKYIDFLEMVDKYRENFYDEEYIEQNTVNPKEFFQYVLDLIEKVEQ